MKIKRILCALMSCCAVVACMPANACALEETASATVLEETQVFAPRATNTFQMTVQAKKISFGDKTLYLEKGEKVTITASYTPTSASVDIGIVDEDGNFTYVNSSNGSISGKITAPQTGSYTFAVENNSSSAISISGTVKY